MKSKTCCVISFTLKRYMKKIAITANTSWYLYNFRKNTILALIAQGYDVFAVAPKDSYSKKLEALGCTHINIAIDQGGTNPIKDFFTFYSFIRILKTVKPSVMLNFTPKNNIYGTLASKVVGCKAINNIAGLGILFINENIASKVAKLLYKISQRYAFKVFFQNEQDKLQFIESNLIKPEKVDRLPGSGADLSRFQLTQAPDDGVVRFLLIARMLYDKGILHYVEAARELKNKYGNKVEFCLLGFLDVNNPSAVKKFEMDAWVKEGIVNYLGVSDSVEVEISKADCMVLPSYYREGVPKSLLEAGAMGKPIITTRSIGCQETVDDGVNGYLCEPRSTESLISKLELITQLSHAERLEMGKRSRNKMELEFDEEIVITKYLKSIRDCFS